MFSDSLMESQRYFFLQCGTFKTQLLGPITTSWNLIGKWIFHSNLPLTPISLIAIMWKIFQLYVLTYKHWKAFSNICVVSSELAALSLDNLRRSLAFGGRRNIPSRQEVGLLLASWRVRSNLSKWTLKFSVPNCWPRLLQTDQNTLPLPVELPGGAVLSFPIDTFSVKKTHPVTFTL